MTYIELTSLDLRSFGIYLTAYITNSIWAFVAGSLASVRCDFFCSAMCGCLVPRPIEWNKKALSHLQNFGKWAFLSSFALAFSMNGDRVLLGLWVTPTLLGYYSIAAGLATMVEGIGNRLFSSLSFPALQRGCADRPLTFFKAHYFRMRWISDAGFVIVWPAFLFASADR